MKLTYIAESSTTKKLPYRQGILPSGIEPMDAWNADQREQLQPQQEILLQICCRYSGRSQSRQLIVAMVRAPVRAILVSDKGRVL
jgi:hypothetical protein